MPAEILMLTTVAAGLFWTCGLLGAFTLAGYPLLLRIRRRLAGRPAESVPALPSVTIVVAAFNEAHVIGQCLENKLALDYPPDLVQILVVSDASTDGTDRIVEQFASRGVTLLRQPARRGKTAALNLARAHATGSLVVFSDANSIYHEQALQAIARAFADRSVGYATGTLVYLSDDGTAVSSNCGTYMRYENHIRLLETAQGSVVGVNGGLDAVRRELWQPMAEHDLPDLVLPLLVVADGHRVVYVPGARYGEVGLQRGADEYRMRVRVALRAMWALFDYRRLLWPSRVGFFAVQVFSHKVLRYLLGVLALGMLVSSAVLAASSWLFLVLLLAQLTFYALALGGLTLGYSKGGTPLLAFPAYFVLVNTAFVHALVLFLAGRRKAIWAPRLG